MNDDNLKMISNDEWLDFLHSLHNEVRNAKSLKLTGLPALNEINNFLMLRFSEPLAILKGLPKECTFSYIYNKFCTKKAIEEDKKEKDYVKRTPYKLWEYVFDRLNDKCVMKQFLSNGFFGKYFKSDVMFVSAYAGNHKVCNTIQKIFILIHDKFEKVKLDYNFFDAFGSAYERFKTDDVSSSGKTTGQHFTPIAIKKLIINELKPQFNEKLYEPCCGSGGFIHTTYNYIRDNDKDEKHYDEFKKNIYANECNPEIMKSLLINLYLHDIPIHDDEDNETRIQEQDSLDYNNCKNYLEKIDIVATNPPFGMSNEIELNDDEMRKYWECLKSGKNIVKDSTAQFLIHIYHSLKIGGRAGVVINRGILNNGSGKKKTWGKVLREFLINNCNIYKIVFIPTGTFDYTKFATAIMFFVKGKKTEKIEIYDCTLIEKSNVKELVVNKKPTKIFTYDELSKNGFSLIIEDENEKKDIEEKIKLGYVKLGNNCDLDKGKCLKINDIVNGLYPVIGGGREPMGYHNEFNREENTILISCSGSYAGYVSRYKQKIWASDCFSIKSKDVTIMTDDYIYYYLVINQDKIYKLQIGSGQPHVYIDNMTSFLIPNLNIEHQKEIVNFLDKQFETYNINRLSEFNNINLFDLLIYKKYDEFEDAMTMIYGKIEADAMTMIYGKIEADAMTIKLEKQKKAIFKMMLSKIKCEKMKLGDVVEFKRGKSLPKHKIIKGNYNVITGGKDKNIFHNEYNIDGNEYVFIARVGTAGYVSICNKKCYQTDLCFAIKPNREILRMYLYYYLLYNQNIVTSKVAKNGPPNINIEKVNIIKIKIPSIEDQEKLIKQIDEIESNESKWEEHAKSLKNIIENMNETITNIINDVKKEENKIKDVEKVDNKKKIEDSDDESSSESDDDDEKPKKVNKKKVKK
jgi:type I restriction-modification system DNA methylase subunit